MKTRFLYTLLLLLATAFAPLRAEILSHRLSVTFNGTPLKQALDEVARLADFEWSYDARMLDGNRRVTLTVRDWTVRETLREILGEGYEFKANGKYLILKKQKPPKSELSGVIRDPKTGERLANVSVYDRKTLRATTTDSTGYYKLKIKKSSEIVVTRLGYRDTVMQVSSLSPHYQKIELAPVPVPVPDSTHKVDPFTKSVHLAADGLEHIYRDFDPDSTDLPEHFRESFQHTSDDLEHFFAATRDKWHDLNIPDTLHRRFQVSLLPNIGTNHVLSGKVENDISLNILAGQSAGVHGVEVAGLCNFTKKEVEGVQVAGLFNLNHGDCLGVEYAGLFNLNQGNVTGVQAAGLFNQTADTLYGVQVAGLVNVARNSPVFFVQAAGLANLVRENGNPGVDGDFSDVPKGIQVAGLMNSTHSFEGVQVAGLVNNTRRMRGLQIGIINRADELHGVQIGLLNFSGGRLLPIVNWGRSRIAD